MKKKYKRLGDNDIVDSNTYALFLDGIHSRFLPLKQYFNGQKIAEIKDKCNELCGDLIAIYRILEEN